MAVKKKYMDVHSMYMSNGDNEVSLSSRVDRDTAYTVEKFAEERGWSKSKAVREIVRQHFQEDEREERKAAGASVVAVVGGSAIGATAAASVVLLALGYLTVGTGLFASTAVVGMTWGLTRFFGWGTVFYDAASAIREGFDAVGGVRGFSAQLKQEFDKGAPVDNPQTIVERAACWDRFIPAFGVVGVIYGLLGVGIAKAGVLESLGPFAVAAYLLGFFVLAYGAPLVMIISSLAVFAIDSASAGRTTNDADGVDAADH